MNFSVTKDGVLLDSSLYTWDEETKTFSSNENNLVLDFTSINGVTFHTGFRCTFITRSDCNFTTGFGCTFYTESYCTFTTGHNCTFKTEHDCTFKTEHDCIFITGSDCNFITGSRCVVIRRDIFEFEVIKLEKDNNHIELNGYEVRGYNDKA